MPSSQMLSFGPYRLDTERVQLWCEAQLVRLTPKAFQVLCYLIERPGQLVTKDVLFQVVWADTVVSDAALTTCVQEIRKALQDNPRSPQYLETVHRLGFRFIATVVSSQHSVASREDEKQTPALSVVEGAKGNGSLESSVQSLESENQSLPLLPARPLDARGQTLDVSAPTRFMRGFVLAAVLLLAVTALTVQYLSLPTSSTQLLTSNPQPALPLPDKPSIAVLPLTNMSGDPAQEYFSDGLTDDLIMDLSRLSRLFVIARNSTFTYKGKPTKVQEISRELGVRYVLEGSVQKAEGQIRINVQLVDALTGDHLWVERYDRPFSDLFTLQDEIVRKIVTTLKLQLTLEEQGYIARKHTDNLEAYDFYLRGVTYLWSATKETTAQARRMSEKAIALDPQYAEAYVGLGWTYGIEWIWRWSTDPQNLERALALAQQALTLDDALPAAHSLLSEVYAMKHQSTPALAEGERAIALDPNNGDSYYFQADALNFAGRPTEALPLVKHAMRLNPHYPDFYVYTLGLAYRLTGQYPEAIAALQETISRNPNFQAAYFHLTASYVQQWAFQQNADAQTLAQALAEAQRIVASNDAYFRGHLILGFVYLWQKQYEQALAEMEQAVALDPNDVLGSALLAETLGRIGRSEEAVKMADQALRLKSLFLYVAGHLDSVGTAYYLAGRPEEAITPLKQFLTHYPNILGAHLTLAAVYSELGRDAEARAEVAEVLRINPNFSLEVHKQRMPIKDPAMLERHIAALRKAGLK